MEVASRSVLVFSLAQCLFSLFMLHKAVSEYLIVK